MWDRVWHSVPDYRAQRKRRNVPGHDRWVGAKFSTEAARTQFDFGLAWIFFEAWVANFGLRSAAPLEYSQHIAGLRSFPALDRIEKGQDAFFGSFFGGGRWKRHQTLRRTVGRITLPEAGSLERHGSVVVERGSPQHGAMRHHAGLNFSYFGGVASGGAAGFFRNAQISGIHEADIVPAFVQPICVGTLGVGGGSCILGIARLRVCLILDLQVLGRILRRARGNTRVEVAAVTIGASETDGCGRMHRRTIGCSVAGQAAGGLPVGVGLRLQKKNIAAILRRSRNFGSDCGNEAQQCRHAHDYHRVVTSQSHASTSFKTGI
jgi:hypothetical protein